MAGGPNTALENGIFFTLFDLLCTAYQKDWYYSFWTVNFRDDLDFTFRLGDLNNARVLFFIASCMNGLHSHFLLYLAIPRASNTVSIMELLAHTLVFNTRSSGKLSSKGFPRVYQWVAAWNSAVQPINPSSWCQNCVSFPSLSFSNSAIHLASSGSHTYHPPSQSYWIFCQPNHSSFSLLLGHFPVHAPEYVYFSATLGCYPLVMKLFFLRGR